MGLDMYLYRLKKVDESDDIEKIGDAFVYYDEYLDGKEVTREDFDKVDPYEYYMMTNGIYEDLDFDIINKYKDHALYSGEGSLSDELIYWGKANAIHQFLVKNSLDYSEDIPYDDFNTKYLEVTPETLIELRDRCKAIVDSVSEKDYSLAKELLPTQGGFCFGSLDYDEFYIDKLEYTIEELNDLFSYEGWKDYHYYYYPFW